MGHNVGQADLKVARSWLAIPKLVSYYDYVPALQTVSGLANGTVSYGTLYRDASGATPKWIPGQLIGPRASILGPPAILRGADYECATPDPSSSAPGSMNSSPAFSTMYPYTQAITCGASTLANQRCHILPVSFDVDHFQQALQDTTPGELGSYFTHSGGTTNFNGVVYITTTSPDYGSLTQVRVPYLRRASAS